MNDQIKAQGRVIQKRFLRGMFLKELPADEALERVKPAVEHFANMFESDYDSVKDYLNGELYKTYLFFRHFDSWEDVKRTFIRGEQ